MRSHAGRGKSLACANIINRELAASTYGKPTCSTCASPRSFAALAKSFPDLTVMSKSSSTTSFRKRPSLCSSVSIVSSSRTLYLVSRPPSPDLPPDCRRIPAGRSGLPPDFDLTALALAMESSPRSVQMPSKTFDRKAMYAASETMLLQTSASSNRERLKQ